MVQHFPILCLNAHHFLSCFRFRFSEKKTGKKKEKRGKINK